MDVKQVMILQKRVGSKLMAAIAMLLISAILLGMSSYAWLVISSAPEVTKIKSTAGANGALEIALQSGGSSGRNEITSGNGTSYAVRSVAEANTYWGNVVDVSAAAYGISDITLMPSRLNLSGGKVVTNSILAIPTYGTDGRITQLDATSALHFSNGSFVDGTNYGVNVLGFSSQSSETETITQSYRRVNVLNEATAQVSNYRESFRTAMQDVISRNSFAIFCALILAAGNATQYERLTTDAEEKAAVANVVNTMDGIMGDVENALRWALLGMAAADTDTYHAADADNGVEDTLGELGGLYRDFLTLPLTSESGAGSVRTIAEANGYDSLVEAVDSLLDVEDAIATSKRFLAGNDRPSLVQAIAALLTPGDTYILRGVDPSAATTSYMIMDPTNGIIADMMSAVRPPMVTEDWIYTLGNRNLFSNMAAILGDYTGDITVYLVNYNMAKDPPASGNYTTFGYHICATTAPAGAQGFKGYDEENNVGALGEVEDTMRSAVVSPYQLISFDVTRVNAVAAHGYSVDLAFRSSEATTLVLQREAADRVTGYTADEAELNGAYNESTMGGGSAMTVTMAGDMTAAQAKELMSSIRVVLMDTSSGAILCVLATDPDDTEVRLGRYASAPLRVYDVTAEGTGYSIESENANDYICDLTADTPRYITAVVYLDGDAVTGGAFSASQAVSLVGSLNLQFASGTALTPMPYGDFIE